MIMASSPSQTRGKTRKSAAPAHRDTQTNLELPLPVLTGLLRTTLRIRRFGGWTVELFPQGIVTPSPRGPGWT